MADPGDDPQPLGRRERGKQAKRERILQAASALFARDGFAAVTTQQIAEAADIGAGTLFRYFATKADILVEVMSHGLGASVMQAIADAEAGGDPVASIAGLFAPLNQIGSEQPENIAVYLRETLFGPDNLRAIGVAQGKAIPLAIEQILVRHADRLPLRADVDVRDAADAIYAMAWLEGLRVITQGLPIAPGRAKHIVEFILRGIAADPNAVSARPRKRR
jgi:TetR/AcrR family transcriptional regulator, cholesterol catabolism regulator